MMRARLFRTMSIALATMMASPCSVVAQTVPAQPAPQRSAAPATDNDNDNDIVVTAIRDIDPNELATRRTLDSRRTGNREQSLQNYDVADRFARCAIKVGMHDTRLLHLALDSVTNSVRQDNAQRRFIQGNAGCAADSTLAGIKGQTTITGIRDSRVTNTMGAEQSLIGLSSDSDLGDPQFYYDRGALFVRAVQAFAPDARLTREQMEDRKVQARFFMREELLAKFRQPQDRQYLGVAICVVRQQPALATRLVVNDLSLSKREDIAATVVNRSRPCFGNARKVYFDTSQFRFYLADALYRWIVAIRGVDSLVPGWENG